MFMLLDVARQALPNHPTASSVSVAYVRRLGPGPPIASSDGGSHGRKTIASTTRAGQGNLLSFDAESCTWYPAMVNWAAGFQLGDALAHRL